VYLEDGSYFFIEKNQRINVGKKDKLYPKEGKVESCQGTVVFERVTVGEMIRGLEKQLGKNAYRYDPVKYNCQNFVSTLSKQVGVNQRLIQFIEANSGKELIRSPVLRKVYKRITDGASIAEQAVLGRGKGETESKPITRPR
jgi:hypothetical protein